VARAQVILPALLILRARLAANPLAAPRPVLS
jgi:hypothetical protein